MSPDLLASVSYKSDLGINGKAIRVYVVFSLVAPHVWGSASQILRQCKIGRMKSDIFSVRGNGSIGPSPNTSAVHRQRLPSVNATRATHREYLHLLLHASAIYLLSFISHI